MLLAMVKVIKNGQTDPNTMVNGKITGPVEKES
jgi:hypothetical protein